MFDRIISMIGESTFEKIKNLRVLVIGLGGVGGYVCESLVRSGVNHITIIDYDRVDITNMNRQIIALTSTIGMKKTELIKKRCLGINPNIDITVVDKKIMPNDIESLSLKNYDFIVDAIDDVDVKVSLIKYSIENDVKLISSMGTAKKINPEKLCICSLDKTSYDPLAKKIRYLLRGINTKKVIVLSSREEVIKTDNGNLGSMIFVPASAGILIANYIIKSVIKQNTL